MIIMNLKYEGKKILSIINKPTHILLYKIIIINIWNAMIKYKNYIHI